MKEVFNPKYEEALHKDVTLGAPLFEQDQRRPLPPETIKVSETQRTAYRDIRESGMMDGMQKRIYMLLQMRGALTRQEISDITGIAVHVVSARICELHTDLGMIEIAATKENPLGKKLNPATNKKNTAYRIKPND
jgi:hypothetical protein